MDEVIRNMDEFKKRYLPEDWKREQEAKKSLADQLLDDIRRRLR